MCERQMREQINYTSIYLKDSKNEMLHLLLTTSILESASRGRHSLTPQPIPRRLVRSGWVYARWSADHCRNKGRP